MTKQKKKPRKAAKKAAKKASKKRPATKTVSEKKKTTLTSKTRKPEGIRKTFFLRPLDDTEPEPRGTAIRAIGAILKDSKLRVLSHLTLGGVFLATDFFSRTNASLNDGVLMWYCFNGLELSAKRFFLGIEPKLLSDVNSGITPSSALTYPLQAFALEEDFPRDAVGAENHLSTIQRPVQDPINPGHTPAQLTRNFTDLLAANKRIVDGREVPYNDGAWAYFQNNSYTGASRGLLNKFVNQTDLAGNPVFYVRYYFAFDTTGKKNAIRIILIATTQSGSILPDYLQKSIPPS